MKRITVTFSNQVRSMIRESKRFADGSPMLETMGMIGQLQEFLWTGSCRANCHAETRKVVSEYGRIMKEVAKVSQRVSIFVDISEGLRTRFDFYEAGKNKSDWGFNFAFSLDNATFATGGSHSTIGTDLYEAAKRA